MLSRFDAPLDPERPLIVLLGDDRDDEDHDLLFPAVWERGAQMVRVHPFELVSHLGPEGIRFTVHDLPLAPDLAVGWVFEDLLLPGLTALEVMQRAGVPVINDTLTLLRTSNKLLDSAARAAAGELDHPAVAGFDGRSLAAWIDRLGTPAVIKPQHGYGGRGVRRIDGIDDLPASDSPDAAAEESYFAMPWIENPGRDIRVYTINHRAVFAMYRYAPDGDWVTNVSAGGTIAVCPLSPQLAELAERVSRGAGTLLGGIDIGEDLATGGYVVYEVNSCPSCEPPVLDLAADFLVAAAQNLGTARDSWVPATVHSAPDPRPELFHLSKQHLLRHP